MEEKKEYTAAIRCKNCGSETPVNIPWGTEVDVFATEYKEKCRFCGVCNWEKGRGMYRTFEK